jgi:hypothetical protein
MIDIICKDCGCSSEIHQISQHGDSIKIQICPCECGTHKGCNSDECEEISELKDQHKTEIAQLHEDVKVLDDIVEAVKKATEGEE